MLRRRILASAMASVMAIGSVAVVASAEDAAVATANLKSKADLDAYVKSFDKFVAETIYDYGSVSAKNILDAYEYAENVLADLGADMYDYTVAYKMLETTYNKKVIYSSAELKTLIDSCKPTYEKGNFYNEDLSDAIYKEDTFETFENAYVEAEKVLGYPDSRVITDTYEVLESAWKGLSKKDTVTKSDFRAALKAYETALQNEYKYDEWRRGTVPSGWIKLMNNWACQKGETVAYGLVYDMVKSISNDIYTQYDLMDGIKQVNITSQEDIVDAYNSCLKATSFLNGFKADDTERATKANVKKLLNDYHSELVHDYAKGEAEALAKAVNAAVNGVKVTLVGLNGYGTREDTLDNAIANELWYEDFVKYTYKGGTAAGNKYKLAEAGIYIKSDTTFYIPVDKEGYWNGNPVVTSKATGVDYKTVTKKSTFDLTDVIKVTDVREYADEQEAIDEVIAEMNDASAARAAEATKTTTGDIVTEAVELAVEAIDNAEAAVATTSAKLDDFVAGYTGANGESLASVVEIVDDILDNATAVLTAVKNGEVPAAKARGAVSTEAEKIDAQLDAIQKVLDSMKVSPWGSEISMWSGQSAFADGLGVRDESLHKGAQDIAWNGGADIIEAGAKVEDELVNVQKSLSKVKAKAAAAANANDEVLDRLEWDDTDNHGVNNIIDDAAETGVVAATTKKVHSDLEEAWTIAQYYLAATKKADYQKKENPILPITTTGEFSADNLSGSSKEWTIVHRYLQYALTDKYGETQGAHGLADVKKLIEESYDLTDLTGDAALFRPHHDALVDTRAAALAWVKEADKMRTNYKDNISTIPYGDPALDLNYVAAQVYDELSGAYKALQNDFNAFKYSFGEVADYIAEVAERIDEEDLTPTDELKAALDAAAYRLSVVESIDGAADAILDDDAFTSDRYFIAYNRIFTNDADYTINGVKVAGPSNAVSATHKALKDAYEALKAEVKKQTEVTTLVGDVNGDGVVDQKDAAEILKAVVNGTVIEVAVGDFNADGAVDQRDAAAILKHVVGLA